MVLNVQIQLFVLNLLEQCHHVEHIKPNVLILVIVLLLLLLVLTKHVQIQILQHHKILIVKIILQVVYLQEMVNV